MRIAIKSFLLVSMAGAACAMGWFNVQLLQTSIPLTPVASDNGQDLVFALSSSEARISQPNYDILQTVKRPVFAQARRPPLKSPKKSLKPKPRRKTAAAKTIPKPNPKGPIGSEFFLLGLLKGNSEGSWALIKGPSGPNGMWIEVGSKLDGWRLDGIDTHSAIISRLESRHILKLYADRPE